jgi:hypothetical protein
MSRIRLDIIALSATLLLGSAPLSTPAAAMEQEPTVRSIRIDRDTRQTLYTLHQIIIPGILFSIKGDMFFNDLFTGNTANFRNIAEGPLGKGYASGMKIAAEKIGGFEVVLISFPDPVFEPLNRHAALVKTGETFRYITLEESGSSIDENPKTNLCEWDAEHQHKSFGPRSYNDLDSFRRDLNKLLLNQ